MGLMLAEVAAFLQTSAVGTLGTDIFIGEIPKGDDLIIVLFETGGMASDHTHDGARDVNPGLQVRIRGKRNGYKAGREKATEVDNLLDGLTNTTLGTHMYKFIFATQQPMFTGYDSTDRPNWTQNFRICRDP